ncbi:hypothetical protein SISNIDRAFT_486657 [Sistotremastrum niveocremeum HHB9708]|uniref:Uncharacterized protein n=1 Tax=Sistotremastrum niveocremeum HHB9708 TaxID=1314777 RepID=A0A164T6Q9_9AGAM|nr:hypothetical protein SISNIDRAFT_486657 [Sistotremastrum niveocremeum HHB9708]
MTPTARGDDEMSMRGWRDDEMERWRDGEMARWAMAASNLLVSQYRALSVEEPFNIFPTMLAPTSKSLSVSACSTAPKLALSLKPVTASAASNGGDGMLSESRANGPVYCDIELATSLPEGSCQSAVLIPPDSGRQSDSSLECAVSDTKKPSNENSQNDSHSLLITSASSQDSSGVAHGGTSDLPSSPSISDIGVHADDNLLDIRIADDDDSVSPGRASKYCKKPGEGLEDLMRALEIAGHPASSAKGQESRKALIVRRATQFLLAYGSL